MWSRLRTAGGENRAPGAVVGAAPFLSRVLGLVLSLAVATAGATVTANVAAGVLTATSDAGDAIVVTAAGGLVKINGADPNSGAAAAASLVRITINGGPLANMIDTSAVTAADFTALTEIFVFANDGDDSFVGGPLAETCDGGPGNDTLNGGAGADNMIGQNDDDAIIWNVNAVTVVLQGGGGTDTIVIDLTGATSEQMTLGLAGTALNLVGTSPVAFTVLNNNSEHVIVTMGPGNDAITVGDLTASPTLLTLTLNGGLGNDTLDASASPAAAAELTLNGGPGNDSIDGGSGPDTLSGGPGNDVVRGHRGADVIDAGADNDTVEWNEGDGTENVEGGDGDDLFVMIGVPENDDLLLGGAPGRVLALSLINDPHLVDTGGFERFDVFGGDGDDAIRVDDLALVAGITLIRCLGEAGDDTLDATLVQAGDVGALEFYGGAGDDILRGSEGDDLLDGGDDNDLLMGFNGDDTLRGGAGGDALLGMGGDDTLDGGDGGDNLRWFAGEGDDTVDGGDGVDVFQVIGGAGDDVQSLAHDGTNLVFTQTGPEPGSCSIVNCEQFTMNGEDGNDRITVGDLSADPLVNLFAISGDGGNDTIDVSALFLPDTGQTLDGGPGDDVITGSQGFDVIGGGPGNDLLDGGGSFDVIDGGEDDDTIFGSVGNDEISGGDGDDIISGGPDDDTIDGGLDTDRIIWFAGHGNDTVDGNSGFDRLEMHGVNDAGPPDDQFAVSEVGGQLQVAWVNGATNTLALQNVDEIELFGHDGADQFAVLDLSGVAAPPAVAIMGGPGSPDTVSVEASAGDDEIAVGDGGLLLGKRILVIDSDVEEVALATGDGDDLITVEPLTTATLLIDGGSESIQDCLFVFTGGELDVDHTTTGPGAGIIDVAGRMLLTYTGFECLDFDIFLVEASGIRVR